MPYSGYWKTSKTWQTSSALSMNPGRKSAWASSSSYRYGTAHVLASTLAVDRGGASPHHMAAPGTDAVELYCLHFFLSPTPTPIFAGVSLGIPHLQRALQAGAVSALGGGRPPLPRVSLCPLQLHARYGGPMAGALPDCQMVLIIVGLLEHAALELSWLVPFEPGMCHRISG